MGVVLFVCLFAKKLKFKSVPTTALYPSQQEAGGRGWAAEVGNKGCRAPCPEVMENCVPRLLRCELHPTLGPTSPTIPQGPGLKS